MSFPVAIFGFGVAMAAFVLSLILYRKIKNQTTSRALSIVSIVLMLIFSLYVPGIMNITDAGFGCDLRIYETNQMEKKLLQDLGKMTIIDGQSTLAEADSNTSKSAFGILNDEGNCANAGPGTTEAHATFNLDDMSLNEALPMIHNNLAKHGFSITKNSNLDNVASGDVRYYTI